MQYVYGRVMILPAYVGSLAVWCYRDMTVYVTLNHWQGPWALMVVPEYHYDSTLYEV